MDALLSVTHPSPTYALRCPRCRRPVYHPRSGKTAWTVAELEGLKRRVVDCPCGEPVRVP